MLGELEQAWQNIVCALLWLVGAALVFPCAALRVIGNAPAIKVVVKVEER